MQLVYPDSRGLLPAVRAWIEHLLRATEEGWLQPNSAPVTTALPSLNLQDT